MNVQDPTDKLSQSLTFPEGRQHDICSVRNTDYQVTLFTRRQITYLNMFLHELEKKTVLT